MDLLVNSSSLLSQLFLKTLVFVPNLLLFLSSPRLTIRSASRRASARLFIYTLGHFLDIRNAHSRSKRFAFKRHCTRRSPQCRKGPLGPFRLSGGCRRLWA